MDTLWLIVLASVVAHVSIAWSAIYFHTKRAEKKWSAKVQTEMIPAAASAAAAEVKAALPDVPSTQAISAAVLAQVNPEAIVAETEERVRVILTNLDFSALADQLYDRVEAGFEGAAGAAKKAADSQAGGALLKELAALDWGSPFANGIWAVLVASQGQRMLTTLGRFARRLPYVGKAAGEFFPQLEGPVQDDGQGGTLVYPQYGR